jgi:hypothetical protein
MSSESTNHTPKKISGKSVWVVAIVVFVFFLLWPHGGESVEKYRERVIAFENQQLESSDNLIRKQIEDAHVTVTAKSARVTACRMLTIDGTDNAGKYGSNIAEVDFVITVIWDGWIQKGGYTEVEIDYDPQNKVVKQTKYLRSNALVNLDNVNWFQVGFDLGKYSSEL